MVYKQDGFTLFKKDVKLKGGREQTIYFFSKKLPKSGDPCELPEGKEVVVNPTTHLPFLRNKK